MLDTGQARAAGERVIAWAEALAAHTDHPGQLTVAYLTPAHRQASLELRQRMREAGFDEVLEDAVGNVVGRYRGREPDAPALVTGSHFDTVRDGGRYDGRLGVLLPIAVVAEYAARGARPRHTLEVVGFAEEEGLRFHSAFLASSALAGSFDFGLLERTDADGTRMDDLMRAHGLAPEAIAGGARDPSRVAAFVEVHIEQGPVLLERGLALGAVSSINGARRVMVRLRGVAGHAGTTPMAMRRDAGAAAAEVVLFVERRCASQPDLVGTVGMLAVPGGSTNVIPGACEFSLDVRAPQDAVRDAALEDILAEIAAVCERRGIACELEHTMNVPAAPCHPELRAQWRAAIEATGQAPIELPSGAGHDAMKMAEIAPIGMLFVRCGAGGISHNPLETITAEDAGAAAGAFAAFVARFRAPAR
ncbi:MAG: allantoate amidohydrolase [Burkholderiales bacterium]|nr:MAG: allantoate amidohydrolase [Burkholderiales bacterium]